MADQDDNRELAGTATQTERNLTTGEEKVIQKRPLYVRPISKTQFEAGEQVGLAKLPGESNEGFGE